MTCGVKPSFCIGTISELSMISAMIRMNDTWTGVSCRYVYAMMDVRQERMN